MKKNRAILGSVVLLYFVIALEILIMVSPFAAFFYAAFNPVLLLVAQHPATRWLAAFFLPHMVLPPGIFLKAVRVAGSILFVAGVLIFLVCAGQVYYKKFTRKGVAVGGLYAWIRHPQYLGLGMTGLGLSILWPRILVLPLWLAMVLLYYALARDEERRMLAQFGAQYRAYMDRTGTFLPKGVEALGLRMLPARSGVARATMAFAILAVLTLGGAFALRAYTVNNLPLWSRGSVAALAILPDDMMMLNHRMAEILDLPEIRARLENEPGPVLVYFLPKDYIMQGMIADTGSQWALYKRRHTLAIFGDWIFHPFRHIEGGCAIMQHGERPGAGTHDIAGGMSRRLIFLRVETTGGRADAAALFAINARRTPIFFADVDVHNAALDDLQDLSQETAWHKVPTPTF
jgi:protein-S-isoprenylcysteine O-methyltransferase Ste14